LAAPAKSAQPLSGDEFGTANMTKPGAVNLASDVNAFCAIADLPG
jgi:hypothetical protein